ncbi:aminotransferase class IV [Niabella pedocola]|uniref:branched-chain-amino-acid transaminase n=1 Tax=Niabella pedocola TaxID=1752077 RepID=A0ABS8PRR5_9BACT|nr:aminotransferase class IV [Niabella pedocola]MCD2423499.1 aminotransferase class IV [Niabella pedocola]
MMRYICFNGVFADAALPAIDAANKSYRYGDGFFETIRVHHAQVPLWQLHRERILRSLSLLGYAFAAGVTIEHLYDQLLELCARNQCTAQARVRISFSNGNGGLFDPSCVHYLIEAHAFTTPVADEGLSLGIYHELQKDAHYFSSLKLSNSFIYSRAAQACNRLGWNDCVIQNKDGAIIETVISNLFWIKNEEIFTPPVTDGCVAGVFRSYLLATEPGITERSCTLNALEEADELFLTNALRGIRKVGQFNGKTYAGDQTTALLSRHQQRLFP